MVVKTYASGVNVPSAALGLARALGAVLLPGFCVACGAPDRSLCDFCSVELLPVPSQVSRSNLIESLDVTVSLSYQGAVRRVLTAFKDDGRTDLAEPLAVALRVSISLALRAKNDWEPDWELCAIPSTRSAYQARGYTPIKVLLARCGLNSLPVLRANSAHVDQSELSLERRLLNANNSFTAVGDLSGRVFLLVDDIVTSGATLAAARHVLAVAGARVAAFVAVAETPRRYPITEPQYRGVT